MNQYHRIAIPKSGLNDSEELELSDLTSDAEIYGVIVLTIEEAKELWDAAQDRMNALETGFPGGTKIFEAYMESKGVIV